jgi:hypothetical protein
MKILLALLLACGLFSTTEHYTSREAYYFVQGGNPHGTKVEEECKLEVSQNEVTVITVAKKDTFSVSLLDTLPTGISARGMVMKGRVAVSKIDSKDSCVVGFGYKNGELVFLSLSDKMAAIVYTVEPRENKNLYTKL